MPIEKYRKVIFYYKPNVYATGKSGEKYLKSGNILQNHSKQSHLAKEPKEFVLKRISWK